MNAIVYLLRSGCPWRYVLRGTFPPRSTVFTSSACLLGWRHGSAAGTTLLICATCVETLGTDRRSRLSITPARLTSASKNVAGGSAKAGRRFRRAGVESRIGPGRLLLLRRGRPRRSSQQCRRGGRAESFSRRKPLPDTGSIFHYSGQHKHQCRQDHSGLSQERHVRTAPFNGYHFVFSGASPITSVRLDPASTFRPRGVRLTGNSVDVDVSGQRTSRDAEAIVDIIRPLRRRRRRRTTPKIPRALWARSLSSRATATASLRSHASSPLLHARVQGVMGPRHGPAGRRPRWRPITGAQALKSVKLDAVQVGPKPRIRRA